MRSEVWDKPTSPYHRGERALHERYDRLEQQTEIARFIHSPQMDVEHREFLASLEYVVIGSVDGQARPWASMLFGPQGFAAGVDAKTVEIAAAPLAGDRLTENLTAGAPMSLLALDLATRRRIRANLTFVEELAPGLRLHVDQSYGNCPKYIQTRTLVSPGDRVRASDVNVETFTELPTDAARLIEVSDTFFVSSYNHDDDQHDVGGVDVNHRGGRPGFVRVEGNKLTIPDYIGNFAFNTLGNFLINPVAGLLFVDFETGDVLQVTGRAEILWDDDPVIADFKGARRAWTLTVEEGVFARGASLAQWEFDSFSPSSLRTGTWAEVPAS